MARLATAERLTDRTKQLETRLEQVTQTAQKLVDVAVKCRELFDKGLDHDADFKKKQKTAQELHSELSKDNLAVFYQALDIVG